MKKLLFTISLLLLSMTVQAAPPTATSFTTTITAVSMSAIQLQGADVDGTPLVYSIVSSPGSGSLSNLNTATGAVVYTPSSTSFVGTVTFTYKVTSGGQDSNTATVTIVVTNQKTRVVDKLTNPNLTPRTGKVTFILARNNNDNTAYMGPSGLIPVSASESAILDAQGQFDISVVPPRSITPQAFYAVWYESTDGRIREPLGLFDIPATTAGSVKLFPYKVTDTSKQARYVFASVAQVEALVQAITGAISAAGVNTFNGRGGTVTLSNTDVVTALGYTPRNNASDTVATVEGTPTQVLVNGTVDTPLTGAVKLTLPQGIATASTPRFAGLYLNGGQLADELLRVAAGNYHAITVDGDATVGVGTSLKSTASGGRQYTILSSGPGAGIGAGKLGFFDDTAGAYRMMIDAAGNFMPGVDASYDLGISDKRFRDGYFSRNVTVGGNLTMQSYTNASPANGHFWFNGTNFIFQEGGVSKTLGSGGGIADPGSNGILARTALNTTAARTITGTSNKITVTNGDGVSGNPTLTVGSDVVEVTKANTFGNFVQTFQGGANHLITDTTDLTKKFQFDVSNVATATTRTVNIPNANSTTVQANTGGANLFVTAISAQGVVSTAQPAFSNLSGTATAGQLPTNVVYNSLSNTYSSGDQDFGLADSLTVPKFTTYSPTTNGRIGYDNTDNVYRVAQGASTRTVVTTTNTAGQILNAQIASGAAITYSKLQSVSATSRVLGRITTGAGVIEELTGSDLRTIASLATTDSPTFAGVTLGANGLTASGSSNGYTGVNVSTSSGTVVANYQGPTGVEYRLKYTTAATDEQYWRIAVGSNYLGYEAVKTDNSGANTAFRVVRSAHVPTYFEVPVAKLNVATTGNGSAQAVVTSASTSLMPLYVYTPASPSVPIAQFAVAGATRFTIENDGGFSSIGVTFANLGAPSNGKFIFCSDCTIANPCASGGSGALAKRLNGAWVCN